MSRPYFITIPKSILETDIVKGILDNNPEIDIYKGNVIYPTRVDRFMLDFEYYCNENNPKDIDLAKTYYHKTYNSNYIYNFYMNKLMKDKYNAELKLESGGGYTGYTASIYIDDDYKYAYFYTINIYKHKKAKKYFDNQKAFFINIYRIPYNTLKIYMYQDTYHARFIQYPRGFEFTCDTNKKWSRLRRKSKNQLVR